MLISVVIPAHNAAPTLDLGLAALERSTHPDFEVVVVDDASDDDTAQVAERHGARLVQLDSPAGPAAARNAGALEAKGPILLFLDADVRVGATTLEKIARHFEAPGAPAAVFGSYDDAPTERRFFSLYKNLFHHFIHQRSKSSASTFWAGCGAVQRRTFVEAGGFNESYRVPSIEDIELGHRMHKTGHRIVLDARIQVTHMKRWTLSKMVWTDVARRAVPWGRLLLRQRKFPADLNLRWRHRLSVALLYCALALGVAIMFAGSKAGSAALGALIVALVATLGLAVALNSDLYRFFARKAGWSFALRAVPVHSFYYLYSGAALVWAALTPHHTPPLRGSLTDSQRNRIVPDPGESVNSSGLNRPRSTHQIPRDRAGRPGRVHRPTVPTAAD